MLNSALLGGALLSTSASLSNSIFCLPWGILSSPADTCWRGPLGYDFFISLSGPLFPIWVTLWFNLTIYWSGGPEGRWWACCTPPASGWRSGPLCIPNVPGCLEFAAPPVRWSWCLLPSPRVPLSPCQVPDPDRADLLRRKVTLAWCSTAVIKTGAQPALPFSYRRWEALHKLPGRPPELYNSPCIISDLRHLSSTPWRTSAKIPILLSLRLLLYLKPLNPLYIAHE